MRMIKKNNMGFAMLEVMLAIVIIAIASFGIYKLYQSSAINTKLIEEENLVSKLITTINQLAYTHNLYPTTDQLYNSGVVSISLWPDTQSDIQAPFGGIQYYYDTTTFSCSRLVHKNIPGSVAKVFADHLQKLGAVSFDDGTDYSTSTVFENGKTYEISVSIPHKGNC